MQVNLIYDSVGSMNTPKAFFKRLTDGGMKVLEFNPVNPLTAKKGWEVNQRDHRKLLIVDGQIAFLGGINISSVYSGGSFSHASKRRPDGSPPWRDTHLQVEGPVVARVPEALPRHLGEAEGRGARGAKLLSPRRPAGARRSCAPSAARPTSPTA